MSNIINLQLSVFCNKHIEPTPEKITEIMGALNDAGELTFVPSVVKGQNVNLATKQVNTVSTLTFATGDQNCQIIYKDNRIDVAYNALGNSFLNYEQDFKQAEEYLKIVIDNDSITGNRLALNLGCISAKSQVSITSDTPLIMRLGKPVDYYDGKNIIEWTARSNCREFAILNGNKEALNVINAFNLIKNNSTEDKHILCLIDINTVAEQKSFRFNAKTISDFVNAIKPIAEVIRADFEALERDV